MDQLPDTKRRRLDINTKLDGIIQSCGIVKKRRDINPIIKHICAQIIDNILNLKYSNEHIKLISSTMKDINNDQNIDDEQYIFKFEQLLQTLINDAKLKSFKN